MHTFFINTSSKGLDKYDVLFDINAENKKLLTMDCPMSAWNDEAEGYKSCVRKMGELIDSYVEITNEFNLIIYIDLHENKEYSAIPKGAMDYEVKRQEYASAMRILYTHVVYETIVDELDKVGRMPDNVLIMFGEEDKDIIKGTGEVSPEDDEIKKLIFSLLGIPAADVINEMAIEVDKAYEAEEERVAAFEERFYPACTEEIVPGLRESHEYSEKLQLMCEKLMNGEGSNLVEDAIGMFYEEVNKINKMETEIGKINFVSCPYDKYSSDVNQKVSALSELNIVLHLLECVETGSKNEKVELIPFRTYTVEELAPVLLAKKEIFSDKAKRIESTEKLYSDLKLTPKLSSFSYTEYGLNKYGKKDEKANDSFRKKLPDDEFKTFEMEKEDEEDSKNRKNDLDAIMAKYNRMADALKQHHDEYLEELENHVSEIMSNYAGKSRENKPAMLRLGRTSYIADAEGNREERAVDTVNKAADNSYDSMIRQYYDFCSGGSVVVTFIDEQCEWFKMRIAQITKSLKTLKLVALGFLIAIIALYLPFIIIQFEAIFRNSLTFITAAGSVAIPIMLLYLIFTAVSARQKRKYGEAWDTFKEKSDEALKRNDENVKKYDELLQKIIPELRWVYEYKLDVDYYKETCDVAGAKLKHHKDKLNKRVEELGNIISDLECGKKDDDKGKVDTGDMPKEIEYQYPFCVGRKNSSFYSIVDVEILSELPEEKGDSKR